MDPNSYGANRRPQFLRNLFVRHFLKVLELERSALLRRQIACVKEIDYRLDKGLLFQKRVWPGGRIEELIVT